MRRFLLLPAVLWACGGSEAAKTDTAAAPAAASLTAAAVTGMYEGSSMDAASDSVVNTWTAWVTADASGALNGKIVNHAAPKDTVSFTQTISGDSVMSASATYTDATAPKGSPPVKWTSVGRASGSDWSGMTTIMVAASDSVVRRVHWKATRTP